MLDLYYRRWKGITLSARDFVLSVDEEKQIQLRMPRHLIEPPTARHPMRVSSDYRRHETCASVVVWHVHRTALFGRMVSTISIMAFDALVITVMKRTPYRTARCVFWIVDNGTIRHG